MSFRCSIRRSSWRTDRALAQGRSQYPGKRRLDGSWMASPGAGCFEHVHAEGLSAPGVRAREPGVPDLVRGRRDRPVVDLGVLADVGWALCWRWLSW